MYGPLKSLLFSLEPEKAHRLAFRLLDEVKDFLPLFSPWLKVKDPRLERRLFGLTFPNPIGLAAGLDKRAEQADAWDRLGFGFAELGTFTAIEQEGNDLPRIFRYPGQQALINRMGFPNPGAEAAAHKLWILKVNGAWPSIPIGINIGKSKAAPLEEAVEDYQKSLAALLPYADYIAVNVSSPNTPGLRKLQEAKALKKLLTALVRQAQGKPVLLKLAPDLAVRSLQEAAATALHCGCVGLIATNTTLSREGLVPSSYPEGGLSGAPLLAPSTQALKVLCKFTKGKVPLIASGGVFNADHVRQKFDAGASLVQLYTGYIFQGPGLPAALCRELLKAPAPVAAEPQALHA